MRIARSFASDSTSPLGPSRASLRGVGEDSDVIAALIRTAFIIAFYLMRYVSRDYHVPLHMSVILLAASLFTLFCLSVYLRGMPLQGLRPAALLLDLLLVSAAISTFRRVGQDLFDLYYLVVIAAAVWYRLYGAVSVAMMSIACSVLSLRYFPVDGYSVQLLLISANPPLLLLIAVIAGYFMRARDSEHLAIVELRQEMRLARALQSQMLPEKLPELSNYDLGLVFNPARQVGGDFYDLRLLDDDHLLIVLADMSGKSVYGLVHLSLVYSHLQAAANKGFSPAQIAAQVNEGTYAALQPESYAAIFVGVLRLSDGLLSFVNCGHVPPVRVRRWGKAKPDRLTTGGTVIGAIADLCYEERAVTLAPGDALVCFSDGLSEARDRAGVSFGEERVVETAAGITDLPAQEYAERLEAAAEKHAARPGQDDVTVVVITRRETAKEAAEAI